MSGEPSIGIDLGTTNSAVATFHGGKLRLIERATGQRLLPSMVGFTTDGKRVVGEEARLLAESSPEQVAWATKRFIGRRWTAELAAEARQHFPFTLVAGPQEDVRVKVGGQVLPVVQLAAALLSELRADAEAHFDAEVRRCVITVPASFNDAQRQATQEAASIAGLEVLRLINEPTAAALAFGLSTGFTGHAVVFDLGGGTFDVSILDCRDGVFEVVGTGGDAFLGGEDFDAVLVQWLLSHLNDPGTRERISHDPQALQRLKAAAEEAKKAVSLTDSARIHVVLGGGDKPGRGQVIDTMLTRHFFERLVRPKTELCLNLVEKTLAESKVDRSQVGAVLLVGGMTRVPLLRQMVIERVGKLPALEVNPDEAVAIGAAIHAAELASKVKKTLLLDVVGSTLSVGIAGGLVQPLIKKNTQLPCAVSDVFHTSRDGQTVARLPVMQGESMHAVDNARLGELKLEGLSGELRSAIEVRFDLSVDGTLSVSARDRATGKSQTARIVARADLRDDERERLKKNESERRDADDGVDPGERHKNRHARRALHEVLVPLRRIHRDLKLAAVETDDGAARDTAESLGRQIVEAEIVETTGTREQVIEVAKKMRELLVKLAELNR
ncbi:MAG: Hsp70 family protein [Archangiaceae bacterium]|nr:Hsp70 family protein [Archangiaceae bacterium]